MKNLTDFSSGRKAKKESKTTFTRGFYTFIALCVVTSGALGYGIRMQMLQKQRTVAASSKLPALEGVKQAASNTAEQVFATEAAFSDVPIVSAMDELAEEPEFVPAVAYEQELRFMMPLIGDILTPHAMDNLVYSRTFEDWRTHNGLDIRGNIGAQVRPSGRGVVEKIYNDDMMGTTVVISHEGSIVTKYSNLQSSVLVREGQQVEGTTVIGGVGNTAPAESADPPHLHFEVWVDGRAVNPVNVLD